MTEEPKSNLPESHEDLTYTSDWHGAPDTALAEMADFADGAKAGVGVTLVIPGGVLSGTIESAQDFFAGIAEPFREAAADEGDEAKIGVVDTYARSFFDKRAQRIQDLVDKDWDDFAAGTIPPIRWPMQRYIHLSGARFIVPGNPGAFELGHTRVLLSQVIGWTLGIAN